jgi:hypothetical protein
MKYKVYEKSESPEEEVCLRLVQDGDRVKVIAVDEDGEKKDNGNLIAFTSDGITRYPGVNCNLGLPLDDDGHLIVEDR